VETAKIKIQELHEHLYQKAKNEALSYPGFYSTSLKKYAIAYQKSLPDTFATSSVNDVIASVLKTKLLLFADFHTLKQTQQGLIKFLKELLLRSKDNTTIMLEAFRYSDQDILDSFIDKKIDEKEFLLKTNYYRSWGFPWENYQPILEFAQTNNLKVLGINTDDAGKDSLQKRDKFAAHIMEDLLKRDPQQTIVCLIGEYHLGDKNLVKYFNKIKPTRLFTNVDRYYFKEASITNPPEYLYLKERCFCLMNSPPWMKWQSYCLWEETRSSYIEQSSDQEEDQDSEESLDLEYHTHSIINHLANLIQLNLSELDLARFSIERKRSHQSMLHKDQIDSSFTEIKRPQFTFDLYSNTIILHDISLNTLAEISGKYLHNIKSPKYNQNDILGSFCHQALNQAAGTITANILNPNYDSSLSNLDISECTLGSVPNECENKACSYTNSIIKEYRQNRIESLKCMSIYKNDIKYKYNISALIGKYIGNVIYQKAINNNSTIDPIRDIFLASTKKTTSINLFRKIVASAFTNHYF